MAISFNPLDVLSGFNLTKLNQNFQNIKTALTDGLSRSGSGSNQMEADIDLNSNDLLNVRQIDTEILMLNGEPVVPADLGNLPNGIIGTNQIANLAVTEAKLGDGSVTDPKVKLGTFASPVKLRNRIDDVYTLTDFGGGSTRTASQNTTALTNALANEQEILVPYHPNGYDFGDGEFIVSAGQFIRNHGFNQVPIRSSAGANGMFRMRGFDERSGIEGLAFDMIGASNPNSAAIRFNTAFTVNWGVRLKNLRFQNCFGAISDDDARILSLTGFQTTISSPIVTVTSVSHGMLFPQVITITGAPTVGGLDMNGQWVASPVSSNTFTFTHSGTASSSAGPTGSGTGTLEVGYLTDIEISDIQCRRARGPQIVSRKSRGSFIFRDVFVDNTVGINSIDPPEFVTWDSILIRDFIGVELTRVDVVGQSFLGPNNDGTLAYFEAGARGIVIEGVSPGERFVWLNRVRAEACNGHGIFITNVDFLESVWLESFACRGFNIYLNDISKGRLVSTYGRGANDLNPTTVGGEITAAANAGAVVIDTCSNLEMHIVGGDSSTRHGIELINSTDCRLYGARAELNTGAGIVEIGTSNNNTVSGYSVANNAGGSVSMAGVGSRNKDGFIAGSRQSDNSSLFSANKNNVDQTGILPATFTKVTFGTESLDTRGNYDVTNSRWTPPAGQVEITARAVVSAGLVAGSDSSILIYKNGTAVAFNTIRPSATTSETLSIVTPPLSTNGTDFFEVYVYIEGAGNKTISGTTTVTSFSGKLL